MITELDLMGIVIKASHAIKLYKWNILYWPTNFGDDSLYYLKALLTIPFSQFNGLQIVRGVVFW